MRPFGTRLRWWVEPTASRRLEALIAAPDDVLRGPGSVAREEGGRKRLFHIENDPGEPALFVKVFTLRAGLPRLSYWLRPSKARREQGIARRVRERGFDVATPVAVGEERRAGLLRRSFSVIPELPARDLRALLEHGELGPAERRSLVEAFAEYSARLHDAGIDQDDFSPNNFLVYTDGRFAMIDFERCAVGTRPLGARRWKLLAKLHRKDLGVSASDRLRFLRRYLGPDSDGAARRRAWERIRVEFRRIRRRDARRAARSAFKVGRHIVRVGDEWVVRARANESRVRLELAARQARATWVRAHQLERLDLPALRPVRLDPEGVELAAPDPADRPPDAEQLIARARRRFARYGRFTAEPDWLLTPGAALLRNPLSFRIEV